MKTVNDMYKNSVTRDIKLLSAFDADFWRDYITNYKRYDNLFRRKYFSFRYFLQFDDTISDITDNFINDVYNHLLLNEKKYSELYRIHIIDDTDYSLTNNYNIREEMDRETSSTNINVYGSRDDSSTDIIGSRSDSSTESIGSRTDITTEDIGSRSDNTNNIIGSQNNSVTSKVAPYDSATFANNTQDDTVLGSRTDSNSFQQGEQTNETNMLLGAQNNTASSILGEQNNSGSFSKGEQTDNLDNDSTENYVLTRVGNIGVQTATDMIDKHKKFWTIWEFYDFIFGEISKELLLV